MERLIRAVIDAAYQPWLITVIWISTGGIAGELAGFWRVDHKFLIYAICGLYLGVTIFEWVKNGD